jgi:ferredoxin-thioredoxin reductase catalytic subunit
MLKMMIGFFKDLWKYRAHVRKQNSWIRRFAKKKNYVVNPNLMMSTNLQIWLAEMEATFGKRYCPCFEPSADPELNRHMLCPCQFIDDEIAEYGSCHCSLFGRATLSKKGWQQSNTRLMKEYRVPLNLQNDVLDTRGMPLDSRRHLPVPDAMHQLKSALNSYKGRTLTLLVEREQEAENLDKIAKYRGYGVRYEKEKDYYRVAVSLDGSPLQGSRSTCGG